MDGMDYSARITRSEHDQFIEDYAHLINPKSHREYFKIDPRKSRSCVVVNLDGNAGIMDKLIKQFGATSSAKYQPHGHCHLTLTVWDGDYLLRSLGFWCGWNEYCKECK